MSTCIYFNPLDLACKNIRGAIQEGESLQLNVFLLKKEKEEHSPSCKCMQFSAQTPNLEDCAVPSQNAFLGINKDGADTVWYPMKKTEFGWTISLEIHEIGLYFYSFSIRSRGYY